MLVSKVPMMNEKHEVIGVLGIYLDITERKKLENSLIETKAHLEAAKEAAKIRTAFLLDMRHDIRTPLSGMIGLANLLVNCAHEPAKVTEYAQDFVSASDALLTYLNKILEAIKTSSGNTPALKQKFNLKETLEEVVHLMQPQSKLKNITLQLQYDDQLPRYFMSDNKRLHRIALELVANALKFTEQGRMCRYARSAS